MCWAVDLLPKVSSKWLSSNQISSSSPPLFRYIAKSVLIYRQKFFEFWNDIRNTYLFRISIRYLKKVIFFINLDMFESFDTIRMSLVRSSQTTSLWRRDLRSYEFNSYICIVDIICSYYSFNHSVQNMVLGLSFCMYL